MFRVLPADSLDYLKLSTSVEIHPSAHVAKGAELGEGVKIGPHAIIGPEVKLDSGVFIGAGAIVDGRVSVGKDTHIYPYATVGSVPQDLKFSGEDTEVHIGARNRIREYVNISLGTGGGGGKTVIGDDNLFMVYTHVAHDCIIGNHCIFANGVQLAGHVHIANRVVFGGMSGAHQFCRMGELAMIGAGAIVVQDVAPYCMVQGDRAQVNGLNIVGLRRAGLSGDRHKDLKNMYRLVFQESLPIDQAVSRIEKEIASTEERTTFVEFVRASERGLCR